MTVVCWRQCANLAGDAPGPPGPCRLVFINNTTLSGSGYGSGFSRTALTTEKIAVLAPMPNARAATAAAVNTRFCRNIRNVCLRSCRNSSTSPSGQRIHHDPLQLDTVSYDLVGGDDQSARSALIASVRLARWAGTNAAPVAIAEMARHTRPIVTPSYGVTSNRSARKADPDSNAIGTAITSPIATRRHALP